MLLHLEKSVCDCRSGVLVFPFTKTGMLYITTRLSKSCASTMLPNLGWGKMNYLQNVATSRVSG